MMDLLCPKCGEPWENDTFHDVAEETGSTYREVAARFRSVGCEAIGTTHNSETQAHPAVWALYDLLGDDMDGAAAMIEDFGLDYF